MLIACELQVEAAKAELRTNAALDRRQARVVGTQANEDAAALALAVAQARQDKTERVSKASHEVATYAPVPDGHFSDAARRAMGIR